VPFSYLDDKQQPVGYSIDLCLRVADAVKNDLKLPAVKVKFNPMTSATRVPLVANGTVDIECGSTVNNVERQAQVGSSDTTFIVSTKFLAASSRNPAEWSIGTEAYSIDPYALMLPRGDAAFKQVVDRALVGLMKSGEILKVYDQWYAKPIPPKNVVLNFPLSPALKRAFDKPTDSPDPSAYE
jgi:ABC-type amino acid transport substrate-binding protein